MFQNRARRYYNIIHTCFSRANKPSGRRRIKESKKREKNCIYRSILYTTRFHDENMIRSLVGGWLFDEAANWFYHTIPMATIFRIAFAKAYSEKTFWAYTYYIHAMCNIVYTIHIGHFLHLRTESFFFCFTHSIHYFFWFYFSRLLWLEFLFGQSNLLLAKSMLLLYYIICDINMYMV